MNIRLAIAIIDVLIAVWCLAGQAYGVEKSAFVSINRPAHDMTFSRKTAPQPVTPDHIKSTVEYGCSGMVIKWSPCGSDSCPRTFILSAAHCGRASRVRLFDGETVGARVVHIWPSSMSYDLQLIELDDDYGLAKIPVIGEGEKPLPPFESVGHPNGVRWPIRKELVLSSTDSHGDWYRVESGYFWHGDSGSGVLDSTGKISGICSRGSGSGPGGGYGYFGSPSYKVIPDFLTEAAKKLRPQ